MGIKALTPADIRGLVRLLGDWDLQTARLARERLARLRGRAVPYLREATGDADPMVRARARLLLEDLRLEGLAAEFAALAERPDPDLDLEEGAWLVARYGYPDLDVGLYRSRLDEMAEAVGAALRPGADMYQAIGVINTALFDRWQFAGDHAHYHDPDNIYLNRVLDRRKGIQISLCTLYVLLARRLGLPVYGVGMPGHFLVQYRGRQESVWIDPFHRGQLLSGEDCAHRLRDLGYPFDESFLQPAATRQIIARTVVNLVRVYSQSGQAQRAQYLEGLVYMLLGRTTREG